MSKNKPQKHTDGAAPDAPATVAHTAPAAPSHPFMHGKKLPIVGDYDKDSKITWLVDRNPRSPGRGTYDRFQKYLGSPTVAAYTEAGGTKGDLMWDLRSGYLSIEGVSLGGELVSRKPRVPPKPKAKKTPAATGVSDAGAAAGLGVQETVV